MWHPGGGRDTASASELRPRLRSRGTLEALNLHSANKKGGGRSESTHTLVTTTGRNAALANEAWRAAARTLPMAALVVTRFCAIRAAVNCVLCKMALQVPVTALLTAALMAWLSTRYPSMRRWFSCRGEKRPHGPRVKARR